LPSSLIGQRVRILAVLQITLQTTPRATGFLLPLEEPEGPLASTAPFGALSKQHKTISQSKYPNLGSRQLGRSGYWQLTMHVSSN